MTMIRKALTMIRKALTILAACTISCAFGFVGARFVGVILPYPTQGTEIVLFYVGVLVIVPGAMWIGFRLALHLND